MDNAVTGNKVLDESMTGTDVANGTLTESDLAFDPATQIELEDHKRSGDHDSRYFTEEELSTLGVINTFDNPV